MINDRATEITKMQVGGSHYTKYAIQPLVFAERLQLTPTLFCAFKYAVRFKDKNGIQDLEKCKHCLSCFMEFGIELPNIDPNTKEYRDFVDQFSGYHRTLVMSILRLQCAKDDYVYNSIVKIIDTFIKELSNE